MFKHVLIERVRFLTLVFSRGPLFISASRISDSLELLLDLHSSERHESLLTSNFRGGNPLYFAKQEEGPVLLCRNWGHKTNDILKVEVICFHEKKKFNIYIYNKAFFFSQTRQIRSSKINSVGSNTNFLNVEPFEVWTPMETMEDRTSNFPNLFGSIKNELGTFQTTQNPRKFGQILGKPSKP